MTPAQTQLLRRILLGVGVLVGLLVIYFVATHGLVQIDTDKEISKVVIGSNNSPEKRQVAAGKSIFSESGPSTIAITFKDGSSYITQKDISGFFFITRIQPSSQKTPAIKKIANDSLSKLFIKNDAPYAYEEGRDGVLALNTTSPFSDNSYRLNDDGSFVSYTRAGNNLFALETESGVSDEGSTYSLSRLDPATNTTTVLLDTLQPDDYLYESDASSIVAYGSDTKQVVRYNFDASENLAGQKLLGKIDSGSVAKYEDRPLVASSKNGYAVVIGEDFVISSDNEHDHEKDVPASRILIYNNESKKTGEITTQKNYFVRSLSLSPSTSHSVITIADTTQVFDSKTGSKILTIPFVLDDILWHDDNVFYAKSTLGGIYKVSVSDKSASTVIGTRDLTITSLSTIIGSRIYFTGYSKSNELQENPAVFYADLVAPAKDDNEVLGVLPYSNADFKLDIFNDTIYLRSVVLTGSLGIPDASDNAEKIELGKNYLKDNLKNPDTYQLVIVGQ